MYNTPDDLLDSHKEHKGTSESKKSDLMAEHMQKHCPRQHTPHIGNSAVLTRL